MTHFDHERIPERIVHARGVGAHGYFQLYESLEAYTKADFLTNPSKHLYLYGSQPFKVLKIQRHSRDVRGFATKFYTDEGNYDLVGNNMPVFFIQMLLNFLILSMQLNQNHIMIFSQELALMIHFGILLRTIPSLLIWLCGR